MKNKHIPPLVPALCLAALILWCAALTAGSPLHNLPNQVQLRWPQALITAPMLEKFSASRQNGGKGVNFSAWRQQAVTVSSSWGSTVQGPGVWYWGRGDQIFPTARLSCGRWTLSQETNQCMVSENMALALWGSASVEGLTLTLQGKEYLVAGVIQNLPPMVLLPASPQEAFSSLVLCPAAGENPKQAAQNLVMEGGLPGDWLLLPASVPKTIAAFAQNLPPVAFALWLVFSQWKKAKGEPSLAQKWGKYGKAAFLAAACAWALGFPPSISQEWLPTRWSDFSFWGESLGQLSNQLITSLTSQKLLPDLLLWQKMGKAILFMALATAAGGVLAAKAKGKPKLSLGASLALCGFLTLAAWWICFLLVGEAAVNQAFLFLPPLAALIGEYPAPFQGPSGP